MREDVREDELVHVSIQGVWAQESAGRVPDPRPSSTFFCCPFGISED
jgi:hypothetical protein